MDKVYIDTDRITVRKLKGIIAAWSDLSLTSAYHFKE